MTSAARHTRGLMKGNAAKKSEKTRRRVAGLETRGGKDASIMNVGDRLGHGEDGQTTVAGTYPDTSIHQWLTDDTGERIARLLGYYLSDGTYSGLEIDVIAKAGSTGDLVLACFTETDNIDVDPARAAIHLRSDGTIVVTQGRFVVNGLMNLDNSTATIASGVITATRSFMTIDTQGGAATDDLDTINGGSEGDILVLISTNNARDITVKDFTGNIQLNGDFLMDTTGDTLTLIKSSTNWKELSRSNNA